ncbi:hypothetical protein Tsubulata_000863 [Turnera subulata]|uniref:VQ domain-containing protein n=1 Tax=Turnera subulata TaxID=218843 RepID=A0A9Q0G870_9ROSI|nr:hypothetical protein Tsubulata_000863 [Turnera subulata]
METYSSSSSSSNPSMYLTEYSQAENSLKAQPSYHASLHSIRKSQVKPWKKPIAPLPPTPPRVYKVDPVNFRDLVQKLTGPVAEPLQPHPQRLQSIAPPPLDLARPPALFSRDVIAAAAPLQLLPSPAKALTPLSALYQELMADTPLDAKAKKAQDTLTMGSSSSLELNLASPSSWCSFPLLSPGTMASLEQSTVL